MSKTKGHKKSVKEHSIAPRKMKPYLADKDAGSGKFAVDLGRGTGISRTGKLITKNANRGKKKAARTQGKKEIKDQLGDI